MTRSEVIERGLEEFRNESEQTGVAARDDPDYEKVVAAAMEKSLQTLEPATHIRTCVNFGHLNIDCCECCHGLYQHYELSLIGLESGGSAWICCGIDRALNPKKYSNSPQIRANVTFDEMLAEFIRRGEDAI